jgi:hypothetical protein
MSFMDKEIERQIEEISSSAIEFRESIDRIIFGRLKDFFREKGKDISRASNLKDLFGKQFRPSDWYQLQDIGLTIPELRRHKAFGYVTTAYVLIAIITWIIIFSTNLDTISVVWTLPLGVIASVMLTVTFSPVLGFMAIFKKRLLPVNNVDNLVNGIIAENWSNLLTDDKRLFKEILEQELAEGKRASA